MEPDNLWVADLAENPNLSLHFLSLLSGPGPAQTCQLDLNSVWRTVIKPTKDKEQNFLGHFHISKFVFYLEIFNFYVRFKYD